MAVTIIPYYYTIYRIIAMATAILSKFAILCTSSYFAVYFLKLKLILFYNNVVYYYTRMFLILFFHPVN